MVVFCLLYSFLLIFLTEYCDPSSFFKRICFYSSSFITGSKTTERRENTHKLSSLAWENLQIIHNLYKYLHPRQLIFSHFTPKTIYYIESIYNMSLKDTLIARYQKENPHKTLSSRHTRVGITDRNQMVSLRWFLSLPVLL